MLSKNWGEPVIFEQQIEIKLLFSVSNLESRIQVYMYFGCVHPWYQN
ncbi:MAG: hypothetical protein P8X74_14995 [Reinekea sp.]